MNEGTEAAGARALAIKPLLLVVAAKSALNLAFATRYGWHRDELYLAVAGRHLQAGYVDFPPVTPLLAAFSRLLFGDSLFALHFLSALAGALVLVLAAMVSRELGGGTRAQLLAVVLVAFAPVLLAINNLFQPNSFDQLATVALLLLTLRLALGHGSKTRNWLLLGVAAGIGLETKYTLAIVLFCLVVAFAVFRRDLLVSRGCLLAAAIAGALMIPNLVWQLEHNWASVSFFVNPPPSASAESRPAFILNTLTFAGLVAIPVMIAGVRELLKRPALRALGWTLIGTVLLYFVLNGKSYYTGPVLIFAAAAGSIRFDRWLTPRRLYATGAVFVVVALISLPLEVPVFPLKAADRHGLVKARSDYASEVGWPGYVAQVAGASRGADVIVTANYGEAGALQVLGHDLPPVASGYVTYRYWRPAVSGRRAVVVGFGRADALSFCRDDYRVLARIRMPVANEERGRPIARCTLRGSLAAVWPRLLALYD